MLDDNTVSPSSFVNTYIIFHHYYWFRKLTC